MDVFRRIFLVAGLAGLVTGILVSIAHMLGPVPIILQAEVYEEAAARTAPAAHAHAPDAAVHVHDEEAWQPGDGIERTLFTVLANLLTAIGFALPLVAAYVLVRAPTMDWRQGLLWGLAGFATFTLAPGLGLPPELPGTEAAPRLARQAWWIATVLATGGGLALIFLTREPVWSAAGVILLVLPHLYGAPQPPEHHSAAPAGLAHAFIVSATVTSFLFWTVLGALTGFLFQRFPPVPSSHEQDRALSRRAG